MREFETGATRDGEIDKYDYEGFLSPQVIESYGKYMHANRIQKDGQRRDSDNWQKGIPRDVYIKSLFRHFIDLWKAHRGSADAPNLETSLNAILFNTMGYLHELLRSRNSTYTIAEVTLAETHSSISPQCHHSQHSVCRGICSCACHSVMGE